MGEDTWKGDVLRLMSPSRLLAGIALVAALFVSTDRLVAQEYCVACTEPPGLYRCIIEGARPGGSQPLQMLCITAMAKEGQHATCGVKGGTVFDCNGQVKRIPWTASNEPGPGQEQTKAPSAQLPAKDPNAPPATVEEMAKRANQKSAEQAKALGQSVGDATKKTWNCITSLFTRCGE
jgi:hypothetical protein